MNQQDHLTLRLARLKSSEQLEHRGDGLIFLFCKGGIGKYTSRLATHRLVPGDILVFNEATGSKLTIFDLTGEFIFWSFSVCFENLLPLFAGDEISLLHHIAEAFEAGRVYPANSPVVAECQRLLAVVPAQFNLDHRGQLIRIAATVLSMEIKEGLTKRNGFGGPEDHMVKVFEKLSASELINLSVGELAQRFSCSRRHLSRLFHQHFGVSVATLRMEMRLLKAISLLRDPEAKIINVAEQCGFNHLGLFNTCFKRRFGASPGQWRKSTVKAGTVLPVVAKNKLSCPFQTTGQCPLEGEAELANRAVMTSIVGKIADGPNVMEDLKRRNLLFGPQVQANMKGQSPSARRVQ